MRRLDPATLAPAPITALVRRTDQPGSPYWLTDDGLVYVERLAAGGATDTAIAGRLNINRNSFRELRHRQDALGEAIARGRSTLDLEVTHHLLSAARRGNVLAAVSLGRLRLGWRDGGSPGEQGVGDLPDRREDHAEESAGFEAAVRTMTPEARANLRAAVLDSLMLTPQQRLARAEELQRTGAAGAAGSPVEAPVPSAPPAEVPIRDLLNVPPVVEPGRWPAGAFPSDPADE